MEYNVFVYGSLMRNRYNHGFIAKAQFIGDAKAEGFEMYDLGSFPAAVKGDGVIYGEVYSVDDETLARLDMLEDNGRMYNRECVQVKLDDTYESVDAYIYIYLGHVYREDRVWEYMQPYGCDRNELVWYVAYGSNLNEERFMHYINGGVYAVTGRKTDGCDDKTPPVRNEAFPIHYERYYGNSSGSWGGKAVAFLDRDRHDNTCGRGWLVTRGQLYDIHKQEGRGTNWYDTVLRLQDKDGYAAYTFTNHTRREEGKPSEKYLEVIHKGFEESWKK